MAITRKLARPLLSAAFINGGVAALKAPGAHASMAEDVAQPTAKAVGIDWDTEQLVKANAAVQIGAGLLLATGRFRRLAALALAGSLVPTTMAGHRFWEAQGEERQGQLIHFLKNLGLLGGLVLAAFDTEGKPGVAWRSKHAIESATTAAGQAIDAATTKAAQAAEHAREEAGKAARRASAKASKAAKKARKAARQAREALPIAA